MKLEYFSDDTYEYSIGWMIAYIRLYRPPTIKLRVEDLQFNLEYPCWDNQVRPIDVIHDIKNKKYREELIRIQHTDMKYPIIVDSNYNIIDGVHRYVKHILEYKKTIRVYMFDKQLMKKFILGKRDEPYSFGIHDLIEMFHQRFTMCKN
jgi:disulfide oxidoreductase YuzD